MPLAGVIAWWNATVLITDMRPCDCSATLCLIPSWFVNQNRTVFLDHCTQYWTQQCQLWDVVCNFVVLAFVWLHLLRLCRFRVFRVWVLSKFCVVNIVKGKIVPVLFLTQHHAMKTYWGSGCIAPRIFGLGTRWRGWSASRPGRFIPRERAPCTYSIGGWLGPQNRSGRDCRMK
jgi:hypothetical protein